MIATAATTVATIVYCIISVTLPPEKSPLPNIYTAEATILVQDSNQTDIAGSILSSLGVDSGTNTNTGVNNGALIIEVLSSRWMLDSLIDEFNIIQRYGISENVKGNSRKAVIDKCAFSYTPNTSALKISYTDIDPVFAKNIVNKMVSLLEAWFNQNRGLAKQKQRQSLEDKILEVKNTIDSLQNRLKSLQRQYGVLNVQELGESQASAIANLRAQLILKEVEIKNYTSFSKIDDPRLEQLKEERQNLLDLIAQTQKTLPESQQFANGGASTALKSLPDVAQEFTQLTLELDIQQKIYNTLSPQYEAAKLAPESEPIFQVLELADVPDIKTGPERSKIVFMAFAVGLFGSLAAVLALHFIRGVVKRTKKNAI